MTLPADVGGVEWVLEAFGCEADRLRDPQALRALVDELVATLALTVGRPAYAR